MLVAALLELKARGLLRRRTSTSELEPEEAAEELARRLEEYRRIKEAAGWLAERLESEPDRYFRLGPAPLAPLPSAGSRRSGPSASRRDPRARHAAAGVSLAHMELRFPPVDAFLERFRAVLRRRSRFVFDSELGGLCRLEQAVAFLALLELRKCGEVRIEQAAPFAPIRVSR